MRHGDDIMCFMAWNAGSALGIGNLGVWRGRGSVSGVVLRAMREAGKLKKKN